MLRPALLAVVRLYRRRLSGRGPFARLRCTFEGLESCSAFAERTLRNTAAPAALGRIARRLGRCRHLSLYRLPGGGLAGGRGYDGAGPRLDAALEADGETDEVRAAVRRAALWCGGQRAAPGPGLLVRDAALVRRALRRRAGCRGAVAVSALALAAFLPAFLGVPALLLAILAGASAWSAWRLERRLDDLEVLSALDGPAGAGLLAVLLLAAPTFAAAPPAVRGDLHGDPLPPGAIARLGTVRWRQGAGIHRMAFTPDGKHLATADRGSLSLWDQRGRRVVTIRDTVTPLGTAFVAGFAFTPDGTRVLSGEGRGTPGSSLLLWELPSGQLLARSPDLGAVPLAIALRRDGRLAACTTSRGEVVVWDLTNGTVRRLCRADGSRVERCLAFSPDGRLLVAVIADEARAIEVSSGKVVRRLPLGLRPRVALAADGTIATYRTADDFCLHNLATGKNHVLDAGDPLRPLALSFSPNGGTLVAWDRPAEAVQVWDTARGRLLRRLALPGLKWTLDHAGLVLSADGKMLIAQQNVALVRWDAVTGKPLPGPPGHVFPPNQIAFSRDGKELTSLADSGGAPAGDLLRWEAATGKTLPCVKPRPPGSALAAEVGCSPRAATTSPRSPSGVCVFTTRARAKRSR
jgi:WD40 repeat protein/putative component of membrane protein insertase Oxa1/YidC/SpoIIIJ protein YidD